MSVSISTEGMVAIPGGTPYGSERYPEEAPVRQVRVDAPYRRRAVTNAVHRVVAATGHVTFAELAPDPKTIGMLPELAHAAVIQATPGPVDPASLSWWRFPAGATWRAVGPR
jgi:hypothetical protein